MDTGIVLIRHGETVWNKEEIFRGRSDVPLNDHGLLQAAATAEMLIDLEFSAIYSSPLSRAMQTAEAICNSRDIKPQPREALTDMSFGPWEGKPYRELAKLYPEEIRKWRETPHQHDIPGIEPMKEVLERAFPEFERLAESNQGKIIGIVSHRVIIKLIILHVMNAGPESFWKIKMDPCSVHMIEYKRGQGFIIVRMNESCHLQHPASSFMHPDF
ncbi:MAG: histidine phosphatase family protein [Bacillota bacterium]|nr:histidine phosphatase family protein [Bacillota bacterium]